MFFDYSNDHSDTDSHDIVDATFVDDEAIVLMANSPRALRVAIDVLLHVISITFQLFHLGINWNPGKTECLLHLRGKKRS